MRNLHILTSLAIIAAIGCTCSPKDKAEATGDTVAVTGVSLSRSEMELTAGDQFKLVARIIPANATNQQVSWTSTLPEVVAVDATCGDARAHEITGTSLGFRALRSSSSAPPVPKSS